MLGAVSGSGVTEGHAEVEGDGVADELGDDEGRGGGSAREGEGDADGVTAAGSLLGDAAALKLAVAEALTTTAMVAAAVTLGDGRAELLGVDGATGS